MRKSRRKYKRGRQIRNIFCLITLLDECPSIWVESSYGFGGGPKPSKFLVNMSLWQLLRLSSKGLLYTVEPIEGM